MRRLHGQIALTNGDLREALEQIRAGDMRPDGPVDDCEICFQLSLGYAFDRGGMTDSAIVMFTRYVESPYLNRLGSDAWHLPRVLRRLGELHDLRGNREPAVVYYSRFVELWKNADSELQPLVMKVRQRLVQLQRSS